MTDATRPPAPEERLLWVYGSVLLRHRNWLVRLPILLGLLAGILTFMKPRQYTGRASFIPADPGSSQAGLSALASQFGFGPTRVSNNSPDFYANLLQSSELLRQALLTRYALSTGDSTTLIKSLRIKPDTGAQALMFGLKAMRANMSASADRLTGIVHLEVYTEDRDLSAEVVRRMLELVNEYNLRSRQIRGGAERAFMEQRVKEVQDQLDAAENALTAFYRRNRTVSSPDLVAEQGRLQRQIALRQQMYVSLSQNLQLARLDEARTTPAIALIEGPEGFVERRARGTLRNLVLGALGGFLIAVGLAFALDYVEGSRRSGSTDFDAFAGLWRQWLSEVRSLGRRRGGNAAG